MDTQHQALVVLYRALDQAGDALSSIHRDDWDRPTPCADWSVRDLAAHLAASPGRFLQMARGEEVDWASVPDGPEHEWVAGFRSAADDLIHHWHGQPDDRVGQADWQSAELGVHTWDLVTALGRPLPLDDEVAERGLAFMSENMPAEHRGSVFGPEVQVPADAPPYDRLVAFAGRDPRA
jgi:uncharacterized protein (TIGR03083 family)